MKNDYKKDEHCKYNEPYHIGYTKEDDSLYFNNGQLEASAYSYEIASTGFISLNKKQTLEIYEGMKKYYNKIN